MGFHPEGAGKDSTAAPNRERKRNRVRAGSAHAALVFDGDECVGWCQFGVPDEVPRIKSRAAYEKERSEPPDRRIACCYVGKGHRRRGVATAGLAGALELIAGLGGGTVEGYPEDGRVAISCRRGLCRVANAPDGVGMTRTLDRAPDLAAGAALIGGPGVVLGDDEVARFVAEQLAAQDLDGRSVCVVVPDATRSCPLPLLLSAVHGALAGRVSRLTVLVALGTHAPMTKGQLARHLGYPRGDLAARYPDMQVRNHEWADPATFVSLGVLPAERVAQLAGGRLAEPVDVRLNRAVVEHDVALVVGPVFPHEVVGFSGGNKYFFPGVAGQEIIDLSHWLGALITSAGIIGTRGLTPVRALIDEAAALIPAQRLALCVVVRSGSGGLHAAAFGEPRAAWAAAADVSAQVHVRYLDAPVHRVLSVIPEKYDDIWTAAKGFYKLEPVVADGGEVILYAPHISRISAMHPEIEQIGYHVRDYFTGQWERFRHLHWGVLAHSTHLRGAGTWDPAHGERPRVRVTLATGIPEEVVRRANLGYLDPAAVDLAAARADEETLLVPDAGEVLFRLR